MQQLTETCFVGFLKFKETKSGPVKEVVIDSGFTTDMFKSKKDFCSKDLDLDTVPFDHFGSCYKQPVEYCVKL